MAGSRSAPFATFLNQVAEAQFPLPTQLIEKRSRILDDFCVTTVERSSEDAGSVVHKTKALERFRTL